MNVSQFIRNIAGAIEVETNLNDYALIMLVYFGITASIISYVVYRFAKKSTRNRNNKEKEVDSKPVFIIVFISVYAPLVYMVFSDK